MKQERYTKAANRRCFSKYSRCSCKFLDVHKKTPVLESLFNKVAGLNLNTSGGCFWVQQSIAKIFQEITSSKSQGQHAVQFNFCRFEGLLYALQLKQIHRGCFPRNFLTHFFLLILLLSRIYIFFEEIGCFCK